MGQLAEKNGKSDGVRSFGQMLQKDHSEANQKATAAANQMGMSPPSEPNSKQKAMYEKMSKLSGDKFDRAFAKDIVADHKKDIKEYEKEAKKDDAAGAYAKEAAAAPCNAGAVGAARPSSPRHPFPAGGRHLIDRDVCFVGQSAPGRE